MNTKSGSSGDAKDGGGKLALNRTTLRVYRYLYRAGKPCGIHDIQRWLGLSSSSVALYDVRKFVDAGLIREEGYSPKQNQAGHCQADEAGQLYADFGKGSTGYVVDRLVFDNQDSLL